ncbi:MAG: 50S ribosomal protein L18 [Candidatus Nezhaarchaeota archaeon]|nr:50S ribosomal protein L18 [Candidatus Nezhaarchaeota archaeon]
MAKGALYKVPFRRRREALTNYRQRKKLVLSGKPLLVVRKTSRHIIAQLVKPHLQGDRVLASATSMEIVRDYGWKGSTKNTSVAYLVGYLIGLKALKKGCEEAVLYIGLHRPTKGARVFAVLKGALDAGLKVPHREEVLPSEGRIKGRHVEDYAKGLLERGPQIYSVKFSEYLKRGLRPEQLSKHFEDCLERIKESLLGEAKEDPPALANGGGD